MKNIILIFLTIFISTASFAQDTDLKKEKKDKEDKKIKIAAIPIIGYNRTIELYFGVMLNGFYKINPLDTISPSSSTGLLGIYSTNNTYFTAFIQQFYLKEDLWRIKLIGGVGNANLQIYSEFQNSGSFVDYNTFMTFLSLDVKRRMLPNFYFGLSGTVARAETTFDLVNPITGENVVDNSQLNNLGFSFLYDSRNSVNYATEGMQINLNNQIFANWLGNDSSFYKVQLSFDKYIKAPNERNVFVLRFATNISMGEVPFQGQTTVGGDDIRGYSQGKYRGEQTYALQTEYRHRFKNRFGYVAFAGIAAATPDFSGLARAQYLPGIGLGIRYMVLEKEKINIGFDVAVGIDDWSFAFRMGDTFGR